MLNKKSIFIYIGFVSKFLSKVNNSITLIGVKKHTHTLTIRYLITFSFCIIIPVIFLVIGINIIYIKSQRKITGIQMQETVNQTSESLGNEISKLKILSSALSHNSTFVEYAFDYIHENDPRKQYILTEKIDLELSRLFLYTNKVGLICVYFKDEPTIMFRNSPLYQHLIKAPKLNKKLIGDIMEREGILQVDNDFYSIFSKDRQAIIQKEEPHLSLAIKPKGEVDFIDKIFFSYPVKQLSSISAKSTISRFSFIVDNGEVILQPKNHNISKVLINRKKNGTLNNKRWILLSSNIPYTSWTLYQAVDVDEFTKPLYVLQKVFFIIIGALILLFILFTYLFFNTLIKPVNLLIDGMSLVEDGNYSVVIPEPKEIEMKRLIHSFNRMVNRIGFLTTENILNEKEKGKLELQALQYQINPHFVANTLNSIRLMAVIRKNENIKNMTASLMKIINDSFRSKGNITTINEERSSLKSYIHIMAVRFSNPIELLFSIDKKLERLKILKMILQPIVENSIVHGFDGKKSKGVILIKVENNKTDNLQITVIDNGCGFTLDENDNKGHASSFTRVGIKNVDRRIKLNYGDNFGLNIISKKGFYTKVSIILPIIEGEQVD